jgi:LysM repeat protein
VSAHHPEQGTYHGLPPDAERERSRWSRRAATWTLAALTLLVIAGLGGLLTAYVVASLRAVPPPDSGFLTTPTPSVGSSPTAPVSPSATPDASQSSAPSPTPTGPTPEPTPEPTPFEYEVQPGDSVTEIALRFGVTPESIIELNALRNPNRILPGQILLIPGAPNASPSPSASP